MAWIKTVEEKDATGEVHELYEWLNQQWGGVPNINKASSLHLPLMKAQIEYFRTLMYGHSALSRARREMIALVVSAQNRCHY